jgi:hypothetical protein
VRIFKTRVFARFARGHRITDKDLRGAVERAGRGLVDADLGGGVIKQRVARAGQGRSGGGGRVLLAFRLKDRAVFIYGFAKTRDNIDDKELRTLREIATAWLAASFQHIEDEITNGRLQEVPHGDGRKEQAKSAD